MCVRYYIWSYLTISLFSDHLPASCCKRRSISMLYSMIHNYYKRNPVTMPPVVAVVQDEPAHISIFSSQISLLHLSFFVKLCPFFFCGCDLWQTPSHNWFYLRFMNSVAGNKMWRLLFLLMRWCALQSPHRRRLQSWQRCVATIFLSQFSHCTSVCSASLPVVSVCLRM